MSGFQTGNYALNGNAFTGWRNTPGLELGARPANVMTVQGSINAAMILTGFSVASAVACGTFLFDRPDTILPGLLISAFGGLILALIMIFKPLTAQFLAIPYAILKGGTLALSSLAAMNALKGTPLGGTAGSGAVFLAAGGTIAVLVSMLGAYKLNIIRNTPFFARMMLIAGLGFMLLSIGSLIAVAFGADLSILFGRGPIAIALSVGILLYSSFCFIQDFDLIEQGAEQQAPKALEWYAGFSLLVTIIMVYTSILRLLIQLAGRRE